MGKSSRNIAAAVDSAIAGRNVFFISPDVVARERHAELAIAEALARKCKLHSCEHMPEKLRAGSGSIVFYALRKDAAGNVLAPMLDVARNRDPHFHTITLGVHEPRMIVDHYAEYLIDRQRRRERTAEESR